MCGTRPWTRSSPPSCDGFPQPCHEKAPTRPDRRRRTGDCRTDCHQSAPQRIPALLGRRRRIGAARARCRPARGHPARLIVEDEAAIAELIAINLRHNGFQPFWAEDGESAQRELDAVLPEVILLDWMLPGQSGLSLARKWRADSRTKPIPILMLTARGDEPDK